jgi:hypothetical protein
LDASVEELDIGDRCRFTEPCTPPFGPTDEEEAEEDITDSEIGSYKEELDEDKLRNLFNGETMPVSEDLLELSCSSSRLP